MSCSVAERFELYLGPLELANGYHELTDATEQRLRFERDIATRSGRGEDAPALDEGLLAALAHGMPVRAARWNGWRRARRGRPRRRCPAA